MRCHDPQGDTTWLPGKPAGADSLPLLGWASGALAWIPRSAVAAAAGSTSSRSFDARCGSTRCRVMSTSSAQGWVRHGRLEFGRSCPPGRLGWRFRLMLVRSVDVRHRPRCWRVRSGDGLRITHRSRSDGPQERTCGAAHDPSSAPVCHDRSGDLPCGFGAVGRRAVTSGCACRCHAAGNGAAGAPGRHLRSRDVP